MFGIERIGKLKPLLVVVAVFIAIASLVTSHILIRDLQREEAKSMEVWAEAMKSLNTADENTDLNLVLKVINGNDKIPIVVLDSARNVLDFRNIDIIAANYEDSLKNIETAAMQMKENERNIRIYLNMHEVNSDDVAGADYIEICYDDS